MIRLDISMALFLYLFFTTIILIVVWAFFGKGAELKTFFSEEKNIWHCEICTHTYVNSKDEGFSKCPVCESINEKMGISEKT